VCLVYIRNRRYLIESFKRKIFIPIDKIDSWDSCFLLIYYTVTSSCILYTSLNPELILNPLNTRMSKLRTLKVAAIQASPVSFDLQLSLEKLKKLTAEAALTGAELVVFP
jgi:hypothetical protein